jgi:hypothetical protein
MKYFSSCVSPEGYFIYGIHKPAYDVTNLRIDEKIRQLGVLLPDRTGVENSANYPDGNLTIEKADWIFEIPNPFPFRGTTFIDKEWADSSAKNYNRISLPSRQDMSFSELLTRTGSDPKLIEHLPAPMQLALATCSTDPKDLELLAAVSCQIDYDHNNNPKGLVYRKDKNGMVPIIHDHALFEAVANNPFLPDPYKIVMVMRPGAQGGSEIVGEWPQDGQTHVFEYLRRNSYIAGGHYAANMADDEVRYSIETLSSADIRGLRHLYYQRTFIRLAALIGISPLPERCLIPSEELEALRQRIIQKITTGEFPHLATLWGWNFGFDYAPSRYRLHASHQQIHQQYAMIPEMVATYSSTTQQSIETMPTFSCGDMITRVIEEYQNLYGKEFFDDYLTAIINNQRMDGHPTLDHDLVVWQDVHTMLFVPKAQTSQWELQLMTRKGPDGRFPGNILEANPEVRQSLDTGILVAQKILASLGARMVTSIEYSKRIGLDIHQPLLYAFLPRLPESPGAFSEAQLRFINGHYPEDFAAVCRQHLPRVSKCLTAQQY